MNSIHEPGSRTMSKNRLRNSTESNRVKNRPSAPSAQPWPARAPRVVRLAARPARIPCAPTPCRTCRLSLARPAPCPRACCAPRTPAVRPARLLCAPRACCAAPCRGLAGRVAALCTDRVQQPCCLSQDTKFCIVTHCFLPSQLPAIQFCNTTSPSLQYKLVYCNTKISRPAFSIAIQCNPCNKIFPLGCNTIQPLLAIQSQPCNTKTFFLTI